jgi:hypothetical protein
MRTHLLILTLGMALSATPLFGGGLDVTYWSPGGLQ